MFSDAETSARTSSEASMSQRTSSEGSERSISETFASEVSENWDFSDAESSLRTSSDEDSDVSLSDSQGSLSDRDSISNASSRTVEDEKPSKAASTGRGRINFPVDLGDSNTNRDLEAAGPTPKQQYLDIYLGILATIVLFLFLCAMFGHLMYSKGTDNGYDKGFVGGAKSFIEDFVKEDRQYNSSDCLPRAEIVSQKEDGVRRLTTIAEYENENCTKGVDKMR